MQNPLSSNLAFATLFRFRTALELILSRSAKVPPMKKTCSRAFTLIELLVVVAIIAILSTILHYESCIIAGRGLP
jgi:prepilin-type N-terminal cleavage/methylation domain-containing protein